MKYEKALRLAQRNLKKVDYCEEYDSAYVFGQDETGEEVAIMKDNGDALTLFEFLEETNYKEKAIRCFSVE